MNTKIGHLVYGIDPKNIPFYRDLFSFLGWKVMWETEHIIGVSGAGDTSLWLGQAVKNHVNDYDGPGLNHVGIHTDSVADVDATVAYLKTQGIHGLFGTPRHHAEFSSDTTDYYQVMFESPDRLLIEVVYTGPLQK